MFAWRPLTFANTTDSLLETIFEEETSITLWSLIGVPGVCITFFGRLQDTIVCDVVLLIALSLYQTMINFTHTLETNGSQENKREDTWGQYEYMTSLALQINDLFGYMIIIIHFYNALAISYFLLEGLKQERKVKTILLGITAAKVAFVYLIASKTSHEVS